MSEKESTRSEYQKDVNNNRSSTDHDDFNAENQTMSRRQRRQLLKSAITDDEKSQNLANKLNIAIILLAFGIIVVFLILFFIG